MTNVPVIDRLPTLPSNVMERSPLALKASFPNGKYFMGVRSIMMIKAHGISYFSTLNIISCKNRNSISLRATSGMPTF